MKATNIYRLGQVKRNRWRLALAVNLAAVVVPLGILAPYVLFNKVSAVADVTAPTLTGASISNGSTFDTVDTMYTGYNATTLSLNTNDDLSGTIAPIIMYTSPSGKQTASGESSNVSNNTEWSTNVNFPKYSEAGTWTATVYLTDISGNKATYNSALLHTLGYNLDVAVTGTGDTTDPVLTGITRTNPGTLNVTDSSPGAGFDLSFTDNISGLGIPTLEYTSPSGNQTTNGQTSCAQQDGWTGTNSTYHCDVYFPHYGESGSWTPDLIFTDGAGNAVHLTNANLLARSIDIRVAVTGTSDTTPPAISNVDITFANPPLDNIPYGGAVLTVNGQISDNLSGLEGTSHISYTSPSGHVVSGDIALQADGTFSSNVFLTTYTEGGTWQPSMYVRDGAGNSETYSSSDLAALGYNLAVTVGKNITETAAPGNTVTSDYENDGATSGNPIEASVTTPTGGPVSIVIVQSDSIDDPANGYTFFDRQINITAPTETVNSPLTLDFLIDSTKVPAGESANTLQITRNGVVVPACTDSTTATPNPCVFSRQDLSGGDVEVKVHSTTASAWTSGFPSHTMTFKGFNQGTKDYPKVNNAQAGQVLPTSFKVKGVAKHVTNILAASSPTTQRVNCNTLALMGSPEAALAKGNSGLHRTGSTFTYDWRTKSAWNNTCRILTVQLNDGTSKKALFDF